MRRDEADYLRAREQYKSLSRREKLQHIWLYDKWYIILGLVAVMVLGSVVYRVLTKKETGLYVGFANFNVTEEQSLALTQSFAEAAGLEQVEVYGGLYLSENATMATHQLAYASRIKLLASIENKTLDLLLVSREAWDILSHSGYLLELPELLARDPALAEALTPCLAENEVILEDNELEVQLGEAQEYWAETRTALNALDVSASPLLASADYDDAVYLVVIANTPRPEVCLEYIRYVLGAP